MIKIKRVPKKTNACYHLHKHLTKYSNEEEFKTKLSSWNPYCIRLTCCETELTLLNFIWKPIWSEKWHLTLWYCITELMHRNSHTDLITDITCVTLMVILFIWFHSFCCFGFSCLSRSYPVSLTEYHVLDFFSSCPWTHSCLQLDLHLVHLQRQQSTIEHQFYTIKTHYCKVQGIKLYNCNHK